MKIDLIGCSHKWEERPENLNFVCTMCGAIGAKDPVRDPLSQNGLIVIRPGKEDLANMVHNKMTAWYIEHKAQILADIKRFGELKTRRKWAIPTGSWSMLMKRFGCRPGAADQVKHEVSLDILPAFPAFSDSWPEQVQLAWLEAYRALRQGAK